MGCLYLKDVAILNLEKRNNWINGEKDIGKTMPLNISNESRTIDNFKNLQMSEICVKTLLMLQLMPSYV